MDFSAGVAVLCADGPCGWSTYVLINPVHRRATHLVVKETMLPCAQRLVPIEAVLEIAPNVIVLHYTQDELNEMDPFTQTEYIREEMPDLEHAPSGYVGIGSYLIWPYVVPERTPILDVDHSQVPLDELRVKRGARVQARDGSVGQVDEFLVNPENEHVTHLMMREGHLWGQKDIAIPVSEIDDAREGAVRLKLSKDEIEALPAIAVRRWGV